jgi:hypothetical protein
MAPEEVIQQVRSDYLSAVDWLQNSVLDDSFNKHPTRAAVYLDGAYLRRYTLLLQPFLTNEAPRFVGVLRADHEVRVRHFSEDGRRCVVIDCQTQRRMATNDRRHNVRLHTQDLDAGAVVYQMVYDSRDRRWKIEAFIQELPAGWWSSKTPQRVKVSIHLPTVSGRDN